MLLLGDIVNCSCEVMALITMYDEDFDIELISKKTLIERNINKLKGFNFLEKDNVLYFKNTQNELISMASITDVFDISKKNGCWTFKEVCPSFDECYFSNEDYIIKELKEKGTYLCKLSSKYITSFGNEGEENDANFNLEIIKKF